MSKDLAILCCNPGAMNGNYFEGTLWKMFDRELTKSGHRQNLTFAAVDSIISLLVPTDTLGALVLETEMNRVKGFDVHSTLEMFNPLKPLGLERLEKHTKSLITGINRVFPEFDRVFVLLNSETYKMCMWAAINETNQWHKTVYYDQLAAAFNRTQILKEMQKDLNAVQMRTGMVRVPEKSTIEAKYIQRWTKYRDNVPEKWQYWQYKQ